MKKPYHPRVEVNYKATMPFIRTFPREAVEQHVRFSCPTNPPDISSELEGVRQAVSEAMSTNTAPPLAAPRFVVTSAPGGTSLTPAPLQLQAAAPEEPAPIAPRFAVPPPPPVTYMQPKATHAPRSASPRPQRGDPAPELMTDHVVVIVGLGIFLGLGWYLWSKWGASSVVAETVEAAAQLPQ